jgi:hypothetical protein
MRPPLPHNDMLLLDVICLFLAILVRTPMSDSAQLLAQAQQHYDDDQYEEAIPILDGILENEPDNAPPIIYVV